MRSQTRLQRRRLRETALLPLLAQVLRFLAPDVVARASAVAREWARCRVPWEALNLVRDTAGCCLLNRSVMGRCVPAAVRDLRMHDWRGRRGCKIRRSDDGEHVAVATKNVAEADLAGWTEPASFVLSFANVATLSLNQSLSKEEVGAIVANVNLVALALQSVSLITAPELEAIATLPLLTCLQLDVRSVQSGEDLERFLARLHADRITTLILWHAEASTNACLRSIARCTKLERLALWQCSRVTDLAPVRALSNLEYLELSCPWGPAGGVTDIGPVLALPRLRALDLQRQALTSLNGISKLTRLTWLCVIGNELGADVREQLDELSGDVEVLWDGMYDP